MRKYRYAEKCLYSYKENEQELAHLNDQLQELRHYGDVHGYRYDAQGRAGGYSDPVCSYVAQIEAIERRLIRARRRVYPVRLLREDVKGEGRTNEHHRLILEEFYIEHIPMTTLLEATHWSRSAFFARRYDLVVRALNYLLE